MTAPRLSLASRFALLVVLVVATTVVVAFALAETLDARATAAGLAVAAGIVLAWVLARPLLGPVRATAQALSDGMNDFVTKPFDRDELRARVRTITRLNRYRKLRDEHEQLIESHIEFGLSGAFDEFTARDTGQALIKSASSGFKSSRPFAPESQSPSVSRVSSTGMRS